MIQPGCRWLNSADIAPYTMVKEIKGAAHEIRSRAGRIRGRD